MTLIVETKKKTQQKEENAALYAAMIKGRKTKLLNKAEKNAFIKNLPGKKLSSKALPS